MHDLALTLDHMRDAVIAGDYGQLAPISAAVEQLLQSVPDLTAADLATIRAKAARNAAALQAAIRGVHAAQRRIADLREVFSGHRTYGPSGKRSAVTGAPATLQQRI
jgi:hypothetical protein